LDWSQPRVPLLLGCEIREGFVVVDQWQQTMRPGVYCAGEPIGIGGVDLAVIEGQIAGFAAAGISDKAKRVSRRARAPSDAVRPRPRLRPRDELRTIAGPDTIVCRCEDVTLGRMGAHPGWRAASSRPVRMALPSRICGPAAEFLLVGNRNRCALPCSRCASIT